MKHIETKKVVALAIIFTICLLAIMQGVVAAINKEPDMIVNSAILTMGSSIIGFYYGYGKGKNDGGEGES